MGQHPLNRFAAFGFVAGDGVIESEFETALGRIRDGVNAIFEIQPTRSFAFAIAFEAAETLCRQKQSRRLGIVNGQGNNGGSEEPQQDGEDFSRQAIIVPWRRQGFGGFVTLAFKRCRHG